MNSVLCRIPYHCKMAAAFRDYAEVFRGKQIQTLYTALPTDVAEQQIRDEFFVYGWLCIEDGINQLRLVKVLG